MSKVSDVPVTEEDTGKGGCRRCLTKGKTAEVMDIPQDLLLVVQLRTV